MSFAAVNKHIPFYSKRSVEKKILTPEWGVWQTSLSYIKQDLDTCIFVFKDGAAMPYRNCYLLHTDISILPIFQIKQPEVALGYTEFYNFVEERQLKCVGNVVWNYVLEKNIHYLYVTRQEVIYQIPTSLELAHCTKNCSYYDEMISNNFCCKWWVNS